MDNKKYIGMDIHQATISVAVRDSAGKLVMESILETKASTILEFIRGLGGNVSVTNRGRDQRRLVIRPAQATRGPSNRMRSAEKRPAESRQQE